jgi:glycosyltransferase involved in cell wall biosynthesis
MSQKRVLIIAKYHGTRVPGLLKYLPECGWSPILLVSSSWGEEIPPGVDVIRTPCRDRLKFLKERLGIKSQQDFRDRVREKVGKASDKTFIDRVLTLGGEIINYPDAEKGWQTFAVKAAGEMLRQGEINVIISSSAPVRCHIISRELKVKYAIPWVADLRDLWSQYYNYSYSRLRRILDRKLEIETLSAADVLTTVSQPLADELFNLHSGKAICVITNGFDPENLELPPLKPTDKFTITYTGNIYSGKRNPVKLFSALTSLISENKVDPTDCEIRFYGPRLKWLEKAINDYNLSNVVNQYGLIPRETAIDRQRESHVLLLLDWDSIKEKGTLPMKVFEYLASGRPVLATGGVEGNAVDELLAETKAGIHAIGIEDIKAALLGFYEEYKQNGSPAFKGIETEISKYSQREMAGKFATIMDRLTAENHPELSK